MDDVFVSGIDEPKVFIEGSPSPAIVFIKYLEYEEAERNEQEKTK